MSVFDETPRSRRRGPLVVVLLSAALAVSSALFVLSQRHPPPVPDHEARPAPARPRPEPKRTPSASRETSTAPAPGRTPREPDAPTTRPAMPTTRPSGALRVRSDVAGASVFLDRKFLGTTPLDVDGLEPGSHRLNVSVEGYEGQAQPVEIGATPAEVEVRFKEVRLNAAIPVVHKHGVGSCSGRLVADTSGLRYETSKTDDAFTMPFADLEGFSVDYLKKALRVKRRGGKTWNFEDPNGQADPLFVFHRDVEKARGRLAGR